MASSQTSNYGLNQWTEEDRVLREEFNQDNAKIDAALDSANCKIKLHDLILERSTSQIDLSLNQVYLSDFLRLELWVPNLFSDNDGSVNIILNGIQDKIYYCRIASSTQDSNSTSLASASFCQTSDGRYSAGLHCLINLFDTGLCGTCESYNGYRYNQDIWGTENLLLWAVHWYHIHPKQLETISLISVNSMLPESQIILYGLRK